MPAAGFEPAAFCSGAIRGDALCSPAISQVGDERKPPSYTPTENGPLSASAAPQPMRARIACHVGTDALLE